MHHLSNYVSRSDSMSHSFTGRAVLVVGLGRFGGGVGVTRWLVEQGASVTVTDQADDTALRESIDALRDVDVRYRLGGHDPDDLHGVDLVVVNPAVDKNRSAFFQHIVRSGIEWTAELNLFCERCPAPVIGVTGSFGKSTTSAMIAETLRYAAGKGQAGYTDVHLGGNIGRSLLGALTTIRESDIVVLEISNAQLEDTPRIGWTPAVAAIVNIRPHHLDRYRSFDEYIAAKLNILAPQNPTEGVSDNRRVPQRVIVGELHPEANAALHARIDETAHQVTHMTNVDLPPFALSVPGAHNQKNARMTAAILNQLGIEEHLIREGLQTFRGLPHRLEIVDTIDGVDYLNDSKSTSPDATVVALEALTGRSIVCIVGGKRKEAVTFEACGRMLAQRCRGVVCMGESGREFERATISYATSNGPIMRRVTSLEEAVTEARTLARNGDAVLFSPGAASFDAYANFTERGDHFVRLVEGPRAQNRNRPGALI